MRYSVSQLHPSGQVEGTRFSIVVIGDGFAESGQEVYNTYVKTLFLDGLLGSGNGFFHDHASAFTIYRINLVSDVAGVSHRQYDDGNIISETPRPSALEIIYNDSWSHCWIEWGAHSLNLIQTLLDAQPPIPDPRLVVIILNEPGWGGCTRDGYVVLTTATDWHVLADKLGHALIASSRYWRRILPSFYYPYRFRGGLIYLDITESKAMVRRVLGVYEPTKYEAISFFLRRGGIFIDVGSNRGDFALFGARSVGNTGQVVAIEPEPTNCYWIKRSIALNGYSNVALHEVALSDYTGKALLYQGNKSGHHSLISGLPGRDKGVIEVETMLLDDLIEELGLLGRVAVIKIDVEGAEMRVLRGAKKTLQVRPQPVLLMDLHPTLGVATEEVCDFLEDLGYAIYKEVPPFDIPVIDRLDIHTLVARPTVSPG